MEMPSRSKSYRLVAGLLILLPTAVFGLDDHDAARGFVVQIDALLGSHPHSIEDLDQIIPLVKANEKRDKIDIVGEIKNSRYFAKIDNHVKYNF